MRRLVLLAFLGVLLWARTAHAAGPAVTVQASPQSGAAPLAVTLTAAGDAATYHWDLGDGTAADGAVVAHTYADAGRYRATVTATGAGAETTQASVEITAYALSLKARSPVQYGRRVAFRGSLRPVEAGARIVLTRDGHNVGVASTRANGTFRIRPRVRVPGLYRAEYEAVQSPTRALRVHPIVTARTAGTPLVGSPLALIAKITPAAAGPLRITISRGNRKVFEGSARSAARIRLKTSSAGVYSIRVRSGAVPGYTQEGKRLRVAISMPNLGPESHGASVRFLEQRLSELHYALMGVDGAYGTDTYDAVLAFQKVNWLPRTGRVDRRLWKRLQHASIPHARYRSGTHFEVDKGRQVLFDVRGGEVARVIQVSTGATGNTPLGAWHVYSKTPGFNSLSMYYSMYFLRGFAIHGYPSVPPYPASHGCVRVPLWVAFSLYETHPYGTTVIIY